MTEGLKCVQRLTLTFPEEKPTKPPLK